MKVSRSLRATIRKGQFQTKLDTAFPEVMRACAAIKRKHEDGTWIGREILDAYGRLFDLGYGHSVETWCEGTLVGGLYGIAVGRAFFGESMFAERSDASKVAVVALCRECERRGIAFIDCQVTTEHLLSLGAREFPRAEFLARLRAAAAADSAPTGRWGENAPAP